MTDFVSGGGQPFVAAGGDGGGLGGGGAIWAIVLIALLGGGLGGRRGDDCGGREAVDNAELNARFNSLENQISNVNDMAEIRATYKEACETNMNVTAQGRDNIIATTEAKYDTALQLKDMQAAQAACCCETNRSIDRAIYEGAKNSWDISKQISDCCCATNQAIQNSTNTILTRLDADKIETLRDKLAEERLLNSQCRQNAELINALRPPVNPAYTVAPPYAPVGYGCGAFGGATGYGYGCAC